MKQRYQKFFKESINSFEEYSTYDPDRAEVIKNSFFKYLGKEPTFKDLDIFYKKNENKFWKPNGFTTNISDYDIEELIRLYLKVSKKPGIYDYGMWRYIK